MRRHGKGKWAKGSKDSDPAHLKLCVRVLCRCLQILDRSFYSQIYVLDMRFFSPRHKDEGFVEAVIPCSTAQRLRYFLRLLSIPRTEQGLDAAGSTCTYRRATSRVIADFLARLHAFQPNRELTLRDVMEALIRHLASRAGPRYAVGSKTVNGKTSVAYTKREASSRTTTDRSHL